jgi:hypothetical protein
MVKSEARVTSEKIKAITPRISRRGRRPQPNEQTTKYTKNMKAGFRVFRAFRGLSPLQKLGQRNAVSQLCSTDFKDLERNSRSSGGFAG